MGEDDPLMRCYLQTGKRPQILTVKHFMVAKHMESISETLCTYLIAKCIDQTYCYLMSVVTTITHRDAISNMLARWLGRLVAQSYQLQQLALVVLKLQSTVSTSNKEKITGIIIGTHFIKTIPLTSESFSGLFS